MCFVDLYCQLLYNIYTIILDGDRMARNNGRKIKLLLIYTFLYTKSNEQNPVGTTEIIKYLADKGIKATRQTIYEDIQVLNAYGFDIICVKSRSNKYFVAERIFELPEIHLLLNIVIGSKFLTVKKTAALIEKVSEVGRNFKKRLKINKKYLKLTDF